MSEEPQVVYVQKGPNSFQSCMGCLGALAIGLFVLIQLSKCSPETVEDAQDIDPQTLQSQTYPGAPEEGTLGARAVRIGDIEAAYAANELAAQQEYGDQWLAVLGTLDSVDLDYADEVVLHFRSDELIRPTASILKGFEGGVAALTKGQEIAVVCGKLSETMGTPRLSECQVLDAEGVAATKVALEE